MKHKKVIHHFTSQNSPSGSKGVIAEVVKEGSDTAKFLEKMKKKRLATRCSKIIDMRKYKRSNCLKYEYKGLTHVLDTHSIEVFERKARQYNGQYTIDVYETVVNTPLPNKTSKKEKNPSNEGGGSVLGHGGRIALIPFGYERQRVEPRLNYTTNVLVTCTKFRNKASKVINISTRGAKLSSAKPLGVEKGDTIKLTYEQLEKNQKNKYGHIQYKVMGYEKQGDMINYRLMRVVNSREKPFDDFITKMIARYSNQYKIDIENNILLLNNLVYQRVYTQCMSSITIFYNCHDENQTLFVGYAGKPKTSLESWLLSSIAEQIPSVLKLENLKTPQRKLINSFLTEKNTPVCYAAFHDELLKNQLYSQFKECSESSHIQDSYFLNIAPLKSNSSTAITKAFEHLSSINPDEAKWLQNSYQQITHVGFLTKIFHTENHTTSLNELSPKLESLNSYICKDISHQFIELGYRKRRKEDRFINKTEVDIFIGDRVISAQTQDFSMGGLKVKLTGKRSLHLAFKLQSEVFVTFKSLSQEPSEQDKLKRILYKVVNINPATNEIGLVRDFHVSSHASSQFFSYFIEENKDKLEKCYADDIAEATSKVLESTTSRNLNHFILFIGKKNDGYFVTKVACSMSGCDLLELFKYKDKQYDISCLSHTDLIESIVPENLAELGGENYPSCHYVLATKTETTPNSDSNTPPAAINLDFFKSGNQINDEVELPKALETEQQKLLRLNVLSPEAFELTEYTEELTMIRKHSPSKANIFETRAISTVAIIEVEDVSMAVSAINK